MLVDFLQDIYDKALGLEKIKEASFYSSIRHLFNRRDYWNEASDALENIIYDLKELDINKGVELMESSLEAQKSYNDIHNFSAVIDTQVVPKVTEYLKRFGGINVTEGDWTLESSLTGFLTLKNNRGEYYHSPADPMWESFLYAYSIFDPAARAYYILGGGLGYLAYALWRMSDGDADIYVFEINKELSEYAELYGVASFIDEDKLHYITGDDTDIILEKYAEGLPGKKIIRTMYYWDITKYDGEYSEFFRIELSSEVTRRIFEYKWRSNYEANILLNHKLFSDLDANLFKDEWVVVGSGPSLNDNEEFIRDSVGKRTICAVNSSFKWFSLHDVKPDLCTVCDPSDLLVPHIEGFEDFSEDVPLVADVVANRGYMELYKGPKYYVYSVAAVLTIGKENIKGDPWSIGGTVTSLALGVAQKLGAKKIYLIGADLGYPEGVTFADGVGHEAKQWKGREGTVISVDDKYIATSIKFREYKHMIEEQIAHYPNIEVVNRSLHGAYLKGTYCNRWWENLPDSSECTDYKDFFENLKKESFLLGWREKYYVFWQILERAQIHKCIFNEEILGIIQEAYAVIYGEFKKEMDWSLPYEGKINSGQTYIFTTEFIDGKDSNDKKLLNIAKNETRNKNIVLIVNTVEKLGGEKVSIHDSIEPGYNHSLETADKVYCENRVFPYFQFNKGMPDIKYYRVFLDSVAKSRPEKIIIASKYSILADYCAEVLNIPTEIEV